MASVLFLDESGDHSLSKIDPQYPLFVLCGVILDEQYHNNFAAKELDDFKQRLFGRREIILHTLEFTRNLPGYEAMSRHDFRTQFFQELEQLIRGLEFRIVACAIKKDALLRKYGLKAIDPYMLSLSIVCCGAICFRDQRRGRSNCGGEQR